MSAGCVSASTVGIGEGIVKDENHLNQLSSVVFHESPGASQRVARSKALSCLVLARLCAFQSLNLNS